MNYFGSKSRQAKYEDWEIGAIGWLCSYNGRGFDGGWGYEAVETKPNGKIVHRKFYEERKNNLLKQAQSLLWQDVKFECLDYREHYPVNCVIYCDPPYKGTTQFANSINFDYEEFWDIMRDWSKRNIVLISEQEAPDDFICIWEKEVVRTITSKTKPKSIEKLFIYKNNI